METVEQSMAAIHNAIRGQGRRTRVKVMYHRYRYNLDQEAAARELANSFGWQFAGLWAAVLHPDGKVDAAGCCLTPQQAAAICRRFPLRSRCLVLDRNLNLDVHGNVALCAGFPHKICSFLAVPLKVIQDRRRADPVCCGCRQRGLARYICGEPHLDSFAAMSVGDCWRYRWTRWRHWLFHWKEMLVR